MREEVVGVGSVARRKRLTSVTHSCCLDRLAVARLSRGCRLDHCLVAGTLGRTHTTNVIEVAVGSPVSHGARLRAHFTRLFPRAGAVVVGSTTAAGTSVRGVVSFTTTRVRHRVGNDGVINID